VRPSGQAGRSRKTWRWASADSGGAAFERCGWRYGCDEDPPSRLAKSQHRNSPSARPHCRRVKCQANARGQEQRADRADAWPTWESPEQAALAARRTMAD